ncbi:MAG: nitrous oxide reductase accessory protein NosL [Halorhabdus sp.]
MNTWLESGECEPSRERDGSCSWAQTHGGATGVTRRRVLGAVGAATTLGLAGCLSAQTPDPVTLTDDDACDVCGMIIPHHPGPSAEIFYRNKDPSGHDNPARFDSTWEAFEYDFDRRDRGWTRAAFYVTDYAAVDYEVRTEAGTQLISTHPQRSAFIDALSASVTFVVGSSVEGAMGQDLIGFSDEADAEAFRGEYGGNLVAFGEVTRSMVGQLSQV